MQRRPDISKAKQLLGWEPGVQLRDGVARTAQYFRDLEARGGLTSTR